MCSIFIPTIRNLLCKMVLMMSPVAFRFTASGLMMASVLCSVLIRSFFLFPGEIYFSLILLIVPRGTSCGHTHRRRHCLPDIRRRLRHPDPRRLQRRDLLLRRTLAAGDDGARVPHSASRRRCLSGNERHYRLLHVPPDVLRRLLLRVAADLADQHNGFGLGIAIEQLQRVHEIRADDGIAADADGRRLPDAALRELVHGFVGQRARARDDADISLLMDPSRHNAKLRLPRRDDAGAVRTDEARAPRLQELPRLHHVQRRDALGDAHDQIHFRIGGFHDGVRRERRGHEDHAGAGAGIARRFFHGVEDGPAFVGGASLARRHSPDDLGAVLLAGLGVEGAFASGQSLHDHFRTFIYENAHGLLYARPAAATTFSAASFMVSATVKFSPESFRIFRPSSTLVPSSRNTMGNWMLVLRAASTTPVASVSTRRMPPKMLMSTAFTCRSLSRISKACVTCSALAPPPTSRKFAGFPPAYLMMSMVAIASPAPFTMQPTLPSSL